MRMDQVRLFENFLVHNIATRYFNEVIDDKVTIRIKKTLKVKYFEDFGCFNL